MYLLLEIEQLPARIMFANYSREPYLQMVAPLEDQMWMGFRKQIIVVNRIGDGYWGSKEILCTAQP